MTQLTSREITDLYNIEIDQTVICKKKYLLQLCHLNYKPIDKKSDEAVKEKYADPAIFYPSLENADCEKRLKLIAEQIHKVNDCSPKESFFMIDPELQFLNRKPVSFLILGKPELGETEVARLLSEHWKCVNLNPNSVVHDEIKSGTRAGKCIDYNLKCGRTIRPDIICRLIEKRTKSQTAQHRGFVISGFPIFQDADASASPLTTEFTYFTVTDILEEIISGIISTETISSLKISKESTKKSEEDVKEADEISTKSDETMEIPEESAGVPEESVGVPEESIAVSEEAEPEATEILMGEDDYKSVRALHKFKEDKWTLLDDLDLGVTEQTFVDDIGIDLSNIETQLEFVFDLFEEPFVIIYLSCNNLDVLNISRKYHNSVTKSVPVESKPKVVVSNKTNEDREVSDNTTAYRVSNKSNLSAQLREYKCKALPLIEDKIVQHNPDHFMKIDARLSAIRIVETILMRLKVLAFSPVVIPEPFKIDEKQFIHDIDETLPESERVPPEKYFQLLRYQKTVSPLYRFELSRWGYKCPVSAKQGRVLKGRADKALKYLNKIFFLSDDDALLNFYRNPRTYISKIDDLPIKVWIMGPELSGRTAISESLIYLFDIKHIFPEKLKQKYIIKQQAEFKENVMKIAIDEAVNILKEKRESSKEALIKEWQEHALELLYEASVYNAYISYIPSEGDNAIVKSFPEIGRSGTEIQEDLAKMNLPSITDITLINDLLNNPEQLSEYLPFSLTESVVIVESCEPFVLNYVNNVLENTSVPEVEITMEILAELIKKAMKKAEYEFYNINNKKRGWVIDGMPVDLEVLQALDKEYIADYIICLKDDQLEHTFLINKFLNQDVGDSTQLQLFLNNVRRFSDAERSPELISKISRIEFVIQLVEQIRKTSVISLHMQSDDNLKSELRKMYTDKIDDFMTKWTKASEYLRGVCQENPLEINVTNKSSLQIIEEAIIYLQNKNRIMPVIVTEEEKMQERQDFLNSIAHQPTYAEVAGEGDEMEGEEKEADDMKDMYFASRRLGITGMYCPVSFFQHFVLWKGKEEFAVRFKNKMYLLSSEAAMHKFIQNPYKILHNTYPIKFPPPRIVLIGALGSGKTTLGISLAENFGLHYLHFDSLLLQHLNINTLQNITDVLLEDNTNINSKEIDIVKDYLNDGNAASTFIYCILNLIWQKEPYVATGFVLDGFPRRVSDIQLMFSHYFIPDIVIELHVTQDDIRGRVLPIQLQQWNTELLEKQRLKKIDNDEILNKWRYERYLHLNFLLNQKREERRIAAYEELISKKRILTTPVSSKISVAATDEYYGEMDLYDYDNFIYTEEQEQEDLKEIEAILNEEMPEPKFDDKWETEAEAIERIQTVIDGNFSREIAYLDLMRVEVLKEKIEYTLISTSNKTPADILNQVSKVTEKFKYRNSAVFERVHEITLPVADQLLEAGYYFLSKFGRLCPVQVYDKANPIHMYLAAEEQLSINPVIHERYIYFLNGIENLNKFKENPLVYIINDDICFPLMPVRIAIIGPPKCGKSTLAQRFQSAFSLKVITRGNAIRYHLSQSPDSELSKRMRYVLERGWTLTDEMVIDAVEALTLSERSVAQGYVLDGFPNTIDEMHHMASRNIIPYVVLDLQADWPKVKECTETYKKEVDNKYSVALVQNKYHFWKKDSGKFRDWMSKEYQNIYPVTTSNTKWHVWIQAKEIVFSVLKSFHKYLKESEFDVPLNLNSLCITSKEFAARQSIYKSYCPCCLKFDNLRYRESTSDWQNVILFLKYYYWICPNHLQDFMESPSKYIPPKNTRVLPKHLPVIINESVTENIHEDGLCIVTFWDEQPEHVLTKGNPNCVVRYKKKHYFFCSEECRNKFMTTPKKYYKKIINFKTPTPLELCEINKLPTLGYLEQCVATLVTQAIINTELVRPYCPGLSVEKSAALNIAFYLKRNNPKTVKENLPFIEDAYAKFEERRKSFKKALFTFKSQRNPFLTVLRPNKQ